MKIALLDNAVANRDFTHQGNTQAIEYCPLNLSCGGLRIDDPTAIHRGDNPVDFQPAFADRYFNHLCNP